MKNQFGQNINEDISKISVLEVYYFKVTTKQSLSSCKQNIDSLFVLTLKYTVNVLSAKSRRALEWSTH